MAKAKKTRARKASGARKISGLPKTKKFGGKTYTKSSCSKLKSAAKKTADNIRSRGKNARVVKNPAGGYCIYTRGASRK